MTGPKILIVCSDSAFAAELEAQLATRGYDVSTNPDPAVKAIADESFVADLVLMDVAAGGGIDMVTTLREILRTREVSVVFMIDASDEPAVMDAEVGESFDYIVKPFSGRHLRVSVELGLSRREATKAVRALEDRFFAVSIDLLCFLDYNGYFKRLNPAWERALGFTREELMSRPFIEFVHPDDRERTLAQNARVRAGGQALGFENRYLCKDGSYRWLRWNAAPDSTESVIYSMARDITESRQKEEEREQLLKKLQDAMAEVKTLRSILPICSYCRKIREEDDWYTVEAYMARHTSTQFSHGICPTCMAAMEPDLAKWEQE